MGGDAQQASEGNDKTNIDWSMQNPYKDTAMERNYWDPNNPASQAQAGFVNRQMQDVAQKYAAKGADVNQQLQDRGVGLTGTIGQFARAQRVENPQASEQSDILNNQFNQNWAGEQGQYGRQADYSQQLNDLAYKKAAGEQQAAFQGRENQLNRRQESQLASSKGMQDLAMTAGAMALGPAGMAGKAAMDENAKYKAKGYSV